MELEMLKKSWGNLNERIEHMATFNDKLVDHIISSRVKTTIDKMNRSYTAFYIILAIELIVLIAILLGNPFDFRYNIQYLPYGLLVIGVIVTFSNLLYVHQSILKVSPHNQIDQYLKSIGGIYDRNKRFKMWFGFIFIAIGMLVPFSFLPTKIDQTALLPALTNTILMVAINLIILIAALKLGVFKNRYKVQLDRDLKEWKKLKALAEETVKA